MSTGTKLDTMTGVVPARTWRTLAVALAASEMFKVRARIAQTACTRNAASLALYLEMQDKGKEHVLATNSVVAWVKRCWNNGNEEVMKRVWKQTILKKKRSFGNNAEGP